MRANGRQAAGGDLSEKRRRNLAASTLEQPPDLLISTVRSAGRRRLDLTSNLLGPTRTRVSVIVSRPIQLREGGVPIRRILLFDDHPATIRLLDGVNRTEKRENILALLQFSGLIVLLLLLMFWRLF